ncbi:Respiratory supercomplex factor 2, mitochondrial [Trametes pubescens]|uniref:Respiratory supercomplex factor 2, mitochondrial n=1 Tax=Trametes pubescens TaxID=154538 RepID=A0A1M2VK80_TRAPU|nr:Respiratory supercomplex factor 2, mitochondrial [Trametes pubescens]
MKFATEEELAGHHSATVRGAIEGVLGGLVLSLPASFYMQRNWAYYRALPPHLKALGVIFVVAPCYAIQAERRGVEFDKSTWTGAGKAELDREERVQQSRWEMMDAKAKFKEWALQNQYKIIVGSWAASMAVAGVIVMRDRYQSTPQKVVQARMWAQGLTIGVLIAAGVLTQSSRQASHDNRSVDHSWANILAEQEKEERENAQFRELARAQAPAPAPST